MELNKFRIYATQDAASEEPVSFETAFKFIAAQASGKSANSSKVKFRRSTKKVSQ
ncbi:hypothetical protein [Rheinheimera sp. MM224]|uniref:hypothetical protein n=1 Tax=Rheinheimera sp. MM224 TaxID=3019969 RepID=UPI0021F8858D|nr:hypothetical protein [Rheinheimera sp. MM224]